MIENDRSQSRSIFRRKPILMRIAANPKWSYRDLFTDLFYRSGALAAAGVEDTLVQLNVETRFLHRHSQFDSFQ